MRGKLQKNPDWKSGSAFQISLGTEKPFSLHGQYYLDPNHQGSFILFILILHCYLLPQHPLLHQGALSSGRLFHTEWRRFGPHAWAVASAFYTSIHSPFVLWVALFLIYHAVQAEAQDSKVI